MSNRNDEPYDDVPECCCAGMEENEKLKREIAEYGAMVNAFRKASDAAKHYIADIRHGVDRDLTLENTLISLLEENIFSTPAQSLHDHDIDIIEDELNMLLLERKNAELKAMVNALLSASNFTGYQMPDDITGTYVMVRTADFNRLKSIRLKTPFQSLHDHDMAIAEAVREACSNAVWHGDYDEVKRIIRNVDLVPIVSEVN